MSGASSGIKSSLMDRLDYDIVSHSFRGCPYLPAVSITVALHARCEMHKLSTSKLVRYLLMMGLMAVVVASPFAFGAVHPLFYTVFQVILFGLFGAGALWYACTKHSTGRQEYRWFPILALAFAALPALQLLPLPAFLAGLISPGTLSTVRGALAWTEGAESTPLTLYPLSTALSALQVLACLALFLLVIFLFHSRRRRLILTWVLIGAGVFLSVVGIYQQAHSPERIYGFWESVQGGLHFGPFVNRNHFAGYVEMIIPLAAALAFAGWQEKRVPGAEPAATPGPTLKTSNLIAIGAFLVMFIALISTMSRGGMVSVAAAACVMSAVAWHRTRSQRAGLAFAGLFAVGFLVGGWFAGPDLAERLGDLYEAATDPWNSTRAVATARTLQLLRHSPVLGVGLGAFQSAFTGVQTAELGPGMFRYAHNDWAQMAAETGLLGCAIALAFAVLLGRAAWQRLRKERRRSGWWLTLGATGSLTALAVHSLFDFNLHIPSNAFLATTVAGILVISAHSARRSAVRRPLIRRRPLLSGAALLGVALALVLLTNTAVNHYRCAAVLRELDNSDRPVKEELLRAHRYFPLEPQPLFLLSTFLTEADPGERIEYSTYQGAIAYGRRAIRLDPGNSRYHHHLATLHRDPPWPIRENDLELAEKHYVQAVKLDPAYPKWTRSLARFYMRRGRFSEADDLYHRLLQINPQQTAAVARELAAAGTGLEHIRKIIPEKADSYLALARELLKVNRTTEAAQLSRKACELAEETQTRALAAKTLAATGEPEEAKHYLRHWMKEAGRHAIYLEALAGIYRGEGKKDAALDVLEELAARFPRQAERHVALGDALRREGKRTNALVAYRQARQLEPRSPAICEKVVGTLLELDRPDEALEVARTQLKRRPGEAEAHYRVGRLLMRRGRVVEATQRFQEALRIAPAMKRYRSAAREAARELRKLRRIGSQLEDDENAVP